MGDGGKERKENGPAERFGRRAALSLAISTSLGRPIRRCFSHSPPGKQARPTRYGQPSTRATSSKNDSNAGNSLSRRRTRSDLQPCTAIADCLRKRKELRKGREEIQQQSLFLRAQTLQRDARLSREAEYRRSFPRQVPTARRTGGVDLGHKSLCGFLVWVIGISDAGQQQDGPQQATTHPTTDPNDGRVPRQQCSSRTRSRTQRYRQAQDSRTHGWVWRQRTPAQGLVRLASGSSRPSVPSTDPRAELSAMTSLLYMFSGRSYWV